MIYYMTLYSSYIDSSVFSYARLHHQEVLSVETKQVCMRPDPDPTVIIYMMMRSTDELGMHNFITAIGATKHINQTEFPDWYDLSKYP